MLAKLAERKGKDMNSESLNSYVSKYIQKADTNHDGKIDKV